jgi:hypothetical protein
VYESSESGTGVSQFCATEKPKLFLLLRIALESPMMAEGEMIFEAVTVTVRGSRRDARASPSEQQYSPIEPDENLLQLPKGVQERGLSTLQPKMRSHTIENRFYAMLLDRPDISIVS